MTRSIWPSLLAAVVVAGIHFGGASWSGPSAKSEGQTASNPEQPKPGATRTNFQRLRKGMTGNEVEAILGPPDQPHLLVRTWTAGETRILLYFRAEAGPQDLRAAFGTCSSPDGPEIQLPE